MRFFPLNWSAKPPRLYRLRIKSQKWHLGIMIQPSATIETLLQETALLDATRLPEWIDQARLAEQALPAFYLSRPTYTRGRLSQTPR